MESRENDKEVYSPLNEFTENNHEAKNQSVETSPLHCNSGDSSLSQRIRDRASLSDANLPSTDENNEHSNVRDRTSSQQSIATTITRSVLDQVSSVVPASIVVAVMPWMEEERALEPHQEAAILLEYARDGQDLNGSKLTLRSRLCYRLRHKYHLFFRAAAWGLVLIHIFERPRWTYDPNNSSDWFDSHKFPSWQLSYIDSTTANILVFVCLIFNWIGVGLELGYKQNTSNVYLPWTAFWILFIKTTVNIGKLIVISQNLAPSFSVSPIEGFLCILVELQHDNNIGFLLRSIPKFCILMVGMAVFVLIYTTLGMLIFDPTEGEGLEIFGNYGIALWNMAMILNGANWPGPMVPAIVQNRLFVLYFYVFLILVVWGLLNIVLGFNYLFFQSEQKEISDLQEKTRINNKADAFRILDIERKGYLTYEQIDALLKEMYEFYEELATPPSTAERYELILSLDIQSNNMIDENDFYFIEQKCFQGALKVMRSRKRKFMRFISANILREQSAQILKKQADKLKIVSVAVGINVHTLNTDNSSNNNTSSSGYRNLEDTESNNENGIELVRPQDSTVSNNTNNNSSHFIQQSESERVISPLHESNTITDNNNEINLDNISNKSNYTTTEAEDLESRERRASLIERASRYASKNVDPKVLAWYKSVGDSQIVEMSRERGRTIAMWVSHFAMQVDSIYFDIFSDTLIVSVGISLLLHNAHKAAVITYNVFTLCEMFLKLSVKGYYRYSMSNRSAIDGKIAITLLALTIIDAAIPHRNHSTIIIKTLVLLRTLLYPRNLIVTNGFKDFRNRQRLAFQYAFGTVDHFNFLLLVLVVMMYIFAGVGQQIFGGTVHRGSQRVEGSAYANSEFWPLNFNDMPSGMVTMFTLLSVNDMNVTASGFTAALSQWAEVFFILWYCLGVLFFLNILTAVFLNQFIGYLEQLAVERRAEAERLRRESDASSIHKPLSIEYYVPSESLDGAQTPPGRRKYSNTSSIGDEDYAHHRSMSVPSYAPETSVPSWMRDHADSSATAPEQHLQRDDAFYPPEYQFEEENVVSGDASQPNAGRRRSMLQVSALLTDATHKTGALLADATHKTGALLTDATAKTGALLSEATMTATTKATELVHSSTTGLNFLKNFLIVDDTQDFVVDSKTTEDAHTATGTGTTVGAHAGVGVVGGESLHLDIHNPLVMGRRRNSSLSSVQSPLTPTGSYFPSHRLSTASNPRINTRRGSNFNFIPLREQDLSLEDTGDEDPNMTALDAIEEEEEEDPTAPITAKKGFTQSIFASDEDRAKIDNWVKSQFKKKRTAARNRRISGYSGGQRSRTNTGGWDVDFSLHPPSIFGGTRSRTESKAITVHSDDMEAGEGKKIGSPMHPGSSIYARKRTISSERGETFNALLSAAANDPTTISTADGGAAVDGMGDGTAGLGDAIGPDVLGGDIDLGSIGGHSRGFHSVHTSDEHASQMQEGIDPSSQTWAEWFYEPNAVSVYEEAAVLIQGAADGEDPNLFTSRRGLQCFQERTRRAWYFKMAAVLYSCLKFFQRPAWTFDQPQWNNSTYFPVSGMPQWSPVVTGSLKIPLLLVIMYGMLLEVGQQEATFVGILRQHTWISTMRYVLLFYCVVQLILVLYSLSGGPQSLVAFSSCGSMLYVLWFNRRSLKKLRMVLQVVPRLSMVMVLYFLIVCMFSGFGPFLYNIEEVGADDDVSGEYYKNFRTATWSIFVAITSSSYPMQIMPAYREYREFSLFFFLFITIGALFMLNLIIAIVFVEFQKASQLNSDYQRAIRQVLLMRAFDILDQDEVDEINIIQLNLLINELIKNYASFQKRLSNPKAREVLIITLDGNFNGLVRMDEFLFFLEKAKFKLPIVAVPTFMEKYFPNIVEKPSFLMLKKMVLYPYTNLIFDCTIAIFTVTSLIVNHNNLYRASPSSVALGAIQMIIMVVEMTVKLMVRGYAAYRRSFRNQLDSTITIGAFISVLGSAAYTGVSMFTIFRRVLLIFRLFWLPRNLRYIFDSKGIKRFAKLCWRIVGKTLTLGIVFMCILYVFASIGTFAFGGLINRDPSGPRYEALMGSRYAADGYFPLNFNDFTSSIITVFACLHVSDFDVITEGMVVTSNSTARIYFALWYIVGVLLMLNILKSFFLDEFLSVFSTGMFGESEPEPSKKLDVVLEEEEDMDSETHVHNPMVYTPLRVCEASSTEGGSSNSSSLMMPPISAELELHRSPAPVLPTIRETESDFESPTHTPSPQPQSSNTSATDLQHTVAGATQREGVLEQLQPAAQPSKPVKPPRSAPPPPPHAPMPPPLPSMPPPPVPKFPLQVAPAAVHTLLEQEEDWVVSEGESDEEGLLETIPEGSEDEGESGAESLDSSRLG